jgi:para-nitrobenzyl esterase
VLPSIPIEAVRAGAGRDLDVLIGTTTEEHALFLVPNGLIDLIDDGALNYTCALLRADPAAVRSAYSADGRSPGEILLAAMTDWFFRVPAIRLAEARSDHGAATFMYEFAWRSPLFNGRLGACHALEVPFVFDALQDEATAWMAGPEPPQRVADDMHAAWVAFVRGGDPGFEPYLPQRRVRRYGEPTETIGDPRAEQRELWTGIR